MGKGKSPHQVMLEQLAICMKNGLLSHHLQKLIKNGF